MTHTASWYASRTAALILGALLCALPVLAKDGNSFSPDNPGLPSTSPSVAAENDAPLGAQAMPSHGPGAVSVDVLRHPIPEKARRMLQGALEKMNSGNDEAARERLLETLAKYPDSAVYVHSILGVIYVRTSRFTDAVNSFELAVSLLPHDAMTHYNFALSLACAGNYDRAEPEVRRALELDPKNTSAQSLLSVLLERKQSAAERRGPAQPVPETEISSRGQRHPGD